MYALFVWPDVTQIAAFTTLVGVIVGGIVTILNNLKPLHQKVATIEEHTDGMLSTMTNQRNAATTRADHAEGVIEGTINNKLILPTPTKKRIL